MYFWGSVIAFYHPKTLFWEKKMFTSRCQIMVKMTRNQFTCEKNNIQSRAVDGLPDGKIESVRKDYFKKRSKKPKPTSKKFHAIYIVFLVLEKAETWWTGKWRPRLKFSESLIFPLKTRESKPPVSNKGTQPLSTLKREAGMGTTVRATGRFFEI